MLMKGNRPKDHRGVRGGLKVSGSYTERVPLLGLNGIDNVAATKSNTIAQCASQVKVSLYDVGHTPIDDECKNSQADGEEKQRTSTVSFAKAIKVDYDARECIGEKIPLVDQLRRDMKLPTAMCMKSRNATVAGLQKLSENDDDDDDDEDFDDDDELSKDESNRADVNNLEDSEERWVEEEQRLKRKRASEDGFCTAAMSVEEIVCSKASTDTSTLESKYQDHLERLGLADSLISMSDAIKKKPELKAGSGLRCLMKRITDSLVTSLAV
jgi:hypothetical protein